MKTSCRPWWRNCALKVDAEILKIDAMEDGLGPLSADVSKVRELISSFELCHHKAEQWIHNIVLAIGQGRSTKGLNTRPFGQWHPAENVWQSANMVLAAWCEGRAKDRADLSIGVVPAIRLLAGLGDRSPLKEWQVQRVIQKIQSVSDWAQSPEPPTIQYEWMLLRGGEYELAYRNECPESFKDHEEFWRTTAQTIIHDTVDGRGTELSLGLAIDMLWPCHWGFVANLQIVLDAIGGNLHPQRPFAACGRNINLVPHQERLRAICDTLRSFCGDPMSKKPDRETIELLDKPTPEKRWLAASLDKTIRLQLDPPPEMRTASALASPAWIREGPGENI